MESKPKVLIIRLSSLGDVVHSTAAITPFIEAGFDILFVTKPAFSGLLKDLSQVQVYEYKSQQEAQEREKFFQWLGTQNISLILDLHDSWRTWSWRRRLNKIAPLIVVRKMRWREIGILLCRWRSWLGLGRGGRAKRYQKIALEALAQLEKFPKNIELTHLQVSAEELASVKKWIPKKDFAVLLPNSAWPGKEWPYFTELASKLGRNIPVLVLGGERDLRCDEVASAAGNFNSESLSLRGKTTIRESMAVLSQAKWIIGNDTGLLHAAEALGKDVAVIEGPTQESLGFSPYRKNSVLVGLSLFCRPCSKSGKICLRFGTYKCMRDLTADSVAEVLRSRGYPC